MFDPHPYDLSILIPARNEAFLALTVKGLLESIEGKTEIIVGLDGQWADPGIVDDPRVKVIYYPKSIGQRAMTNQLARLSKAKYIAKTDAHCIFDKGFDVKLMADMQDDWTVVPTMRNIHAFDWVCEKCGNRWYQSPTPKFCKSDYDGKIQNMKCDSTNFKKEIIWIAKRSPQSNSFTFDTTLHFQYFREYDKRPEAQKQITESMSLQGSFFMLTREKYWELNICDERHGSWGQQGVEVACKTWLSGGKVMCNKNTWYGHLFRTQGGDFSFPYYQNQKDVEKARDYSRDIWFNNKFDKQIYPLQWLIEKFRPLPDWDMPVNANAFETAARVKSEGEKFYAKQGKRKGIIYFTDNQLNVKIARAVQDNLKKMRLPITSSSLKPMDFGNNVHLPLERGYMTMFKQILAALEASTADIVYFCEHDVLYHPSHFDFTPESEDKFYYNQNWWKVWQDGFVAHWDANQVSGLCVYRKLAIEFYKERIKEIEEKGFNRSYEPGGRDATKYRIWKSEYPNIDIRHEGNLTNSHRRLEEFRDKSTAAGFMEGSLESIPGWDTNTLKNLINRK